MISRRHLALAGGLVAAALFLLSSDDSRESSELAAPPLVVPEASSLMRLAPGAVYRHASERHSVDSAATPEHGDTVGRPRPLDPPK